jgi:hypothetical protein
MDKATTSRKKTTRESAFEKQQRQAMLRNAAIAIVAVFVVGAGIFYVVNETIRGTQDAERPPAHANEQIIPDAGAGHVAEGSPLVFDHYPPSSGSHYPTWADPGFYDAPISEGYWVHSLEHGDVVILYNCPDGDCTELKTQIRELRDQLPRRRCDLIRVLAIPYSQGMSTPITVVAWGRQLDLPEFDAQAIEDFYKRHEDRGPENIPC